MTLDIFNHPLRQRPRCLKSGEIAYFGKKSLLRNRDEVAIILSLITNRRLFGEIFAGLDAIFFYNMPQGSGVFIQPIIQTHKLAPGNSWPGDIDLMIIPYERDRLLLHRTTAIEVKIVRASFVRQGKSPNEFGFHQANGLLEMGFPYVAVAHLIVSDKAPPESWTLTSVAKVLDRFGNVEILSDQLADMMPVRLIQRTFGRLNARCENKNIGLISAYIGATDEEIAGVDGRGGVWMPHVRKASFNEKYSKELLWRISQYFEAEYLQFFDNPRHDPL